MGWGAVIRSLDYMVASEEENAVGLLETLVIGVY